MVKGMVTIKINKGRVLSNNTGGWSIKVCLEDGFVYGTLLAKTTPWDGCETLSAFNVPYDGRRLTLNLPEAYERFGDNRHFASARANYIMPAFIDLDYDVVGGLWYKRICAC